MEPVETGPEESGSEPRKRRGRPPKKQRRNDPVDAPVDGVYRILDLKGQDARFDYCWLTADVWPEYRIDGWVAETWQVNGKGEPTCARPHWVQPEDFKVGDQITFKELRLCKILKTRRAAVESRKRAPFNAALAGMKARAESTGGYLKNVVVPMGGA